MLVSESFLPGALCTLALTASIHYLLVYRPQSWGEFLRLPCLCWILDPFRIKTRKDPKLFPSSLYSNRLQGLESGCLRFCPRGKNRPTRPTTAVSARIANCRSRLGYSLTHPGAVKDHPTHHVPDPTPGFLSKSSPRLLPLSSVRPRNKQASLGLT